MALTMLSAQGYVFNLFVQPTTQSPKIFSPSLLLQKTHIWKVGTFLFCFFIFAWKKKIINDLSKL